MATTIVTPSASTQNDTSALGVVIGLILATAVGILFFLYAIPAIQNAGNTDTGESSRIEVNIPTPNMPQNPTTQPESTQPTPTP